MIDVGVLAVVGISCIIGLIRGATRELLGLVSWVGAIMAAFFFLPLVRHIARQHIQNPMIADVATGLVIFIAFLIIFSLISHVLSGYVKDSALGGVDRSLGFGFGIFRALVFLSAAEIVLCIFISRPQQPTAVQNSRFIIMIRRASDGLRMMLPGSWREFLDSHKIKTLPTQAVEKAQDQIIDQVTESMGIQVQPEQKKLDPQKTAEQLAQLKPRVAEEQKDKGYNQNQRQGLSQLVEESAKKAEQPPVQPVQKELPKVIQEIQE